MTALRFLWKSESRLIRSELKILLTIVQLSENAYPSAHSQQRVFYLWCAITFQLGVLVWWVACLPFFLHCHHFPIMACSCIICYCLSHLWDNLSNEPKSHIIIINKYLSHLAMANAMLAFPSQTFLPLMHVNSLIKLSCCAIKLHSYLPKLQPWEHVRTSAGHPRL